MDKRLPVRFLGVFLLLQACAYYALASREDRIPAMPPLSSLPRVSGPWTVTGEYPLEKETADVLKADDTVNRFYSRGAGPQAALFVAFFKSQRFGQAPHSPKNCLPGSGWEPMADSRIMVDIPGRAAPIRVNRYVVARGAEKSVVLYWYQSHDRAIAGEIEAKFWLVADSIRYRRSDTALVRIIAPVGPRGIDAAGETAVDLLRSVYPDLSRNLAQ